MPILIDAVMDTNVLIAGLRSRTGASFEFLQRIGASPLRLHISTALLLEYESIAKRDAAKFWLRPELIDAVLDYICANSVEHSIDFKWRPFLQDPNDDFILELATAAQVSYIVTYNVRNFAGIEAFGIAAITPVEMLQALERAQ